jgi:hypothetical protein
MEMPARRSPLTAEFTTGARSSVIFVASPDLLHQQIISFIQLISEQSSELKLFRHLQTTIYVTFFSAQNLRHKGIKRDEINNYKDIY